MNYSALAIISKEWFVIMQRTRVNFFIIPTALLTTVTLLIDPLLLFCILCNPSFRQETRYLLLANTLLSDVLFLVFNLVNLSTNAVDMELDNVACEFIMVATVTTYCSSVLTVTLMVIDTFVAVRWPLRYNEIMSPSRVMKIIGVVWAIAAVYPLALVMEVYKKETPQSFKVCVVIITLRSLGEQIMVGLQIYFNLWAIICAVLIIYCYARLYSVTRSSGIWTSRYSRARLTLLAHALMLLMYFTPCVIFTVELKLYGLNQTSEQEVWLNTVNLTVMMVLPRACTPYLYGLRYRKIYETVRLMLQKSWAVKIRQVEAS